MRKYPEEMQCVCKKDKVIQAKKIWESNYKTTIIELEELKDKHKEMEKEKKDVEGKYASIKEVYEQTKILSEQTKIKLKNHHQEKETSEEIIKALRKNKDRQCSKQKITDKTITDKFRKKNQWKEWKKKAV